MRPRHGFAVMDDRMDARIGRVLASMDNILIRQTLLGTVCPWMPALAGEAPMVQLK
jgi:hypothetical protein